MKTFEIHNVSKVYNPKKQAKVNALSNVSLTFGDRGLVFIVGKSGSGKSTLLNILGGLDSCTSGEIIIDGKSTNDFTELDFNRYRNYYVGFVFQEFNLLEKLTVGENLKLALELQGKTATNAEINNALNNVGLTGYAPRKATELSGGQRQRVALARALVKSTKIILADEPTGSLDSNTSEELFNLLKDISKKQLVIIVSHDAESAERYGDRIIRFSDGKVTDDIIKNKQNLSSIKNNPDQSIINNDNQQLLPVTTNNCNRFDINTQNKKTSLKFSRIFKMGLGIIATHPIRMLITVFLFFITLAFLGVGITASSMSKNDIMYNLISNNNLINILSVNDVNGENLDSIKNKFPQYDYYEIYDTDTFNVEFNHFTEINKGDNFHTTNISGATNISEDELKM